MSASKSGESKTLGIKLAYSSDARKNYERSAFIKAAESSWSRRIW